jgi:threonine synthase
LTEQDAVLNILGATSGDTGSAAIAGVRGKPGIRIFIMFPDGRTSPIQERQMTTVLDDNVYNLSIDGSFDDCQNLLKTVFNDLSFKETYALGAVNSVNWARVLAQVVYYFWTWYQLKQPAEFDVTVPTGNFGNIFAGFIAKRMGLPLRKLVLATNENDILARFFQSGVYERGAVRFSNSPAMDIQVASNFERYLFYQLGENATDCAAFMKRFQTEQCASLVEPAGFFDWFTADAVSDTETLESIQGIWREFNYLADPHTAVGFHLAQKQIHEFIDVSTQNQTLFQLCHQLVQQLQKPQSIQAATARLGEILKATLDTRDYHLFIFQDKAEPDCTATSFVSQANFQTAVGGLFNPDKPILGVVRAEESKCLFPDLDHDISSCAIIPLVSEDLVGALTIGSQDSNGFHRDQDTLFIQFIGDFLAGLIKHRFLIDDPKQGD